MFINIVLNNVIFTSKIIWDNRKMKHRLLNKIQSTVAITLFIIIFYMCYKTTSFKLTEIPLSYYGVYSRYKFLWNLVIMFLSISIFSNIRHYIILINAINRNLTILLFLFLSTCLFIVGLIPMPSIIHTISAYIYFFGYPLAIFFIYSNK